MSADEILPASFPKVIPAEMSAALLRDVANALESAFAAEIKIVTRAQRMVELGGARYGGPQDTGKGTLHYFSDPLTGTSLALYERDLTVAAVEARVKASRITFGVAVSL